MPLMPLLGYNSYMTEKYTIEKAYRMNSKGMDVFDGWDIFCNGNWCNRFWTKRDAKAALAAEGIFL